MPSTPMDAGSTTPPATSGSGARIPSTAIRRWSPAVAPTSVTTLIATATGSRPGAPTLWTPQRETRDSGAPATTHYLGRRDEQQERRGQARLPADSRPALRGSDHLRREGPRHVLPPDRAASPARGGAECT